MNTGLEGRVAVVTGAASGIGLASARALSDEGCRVVAVDLRDDSSAYADDWCRLALDVSEPDAGERLVHATLEAFGQLDVLVACAGVYETAELGEVSADGFDHVVAVNVRGALLCAKSAIEAMRRQGRGRVVLLSSIAAHTGGLSAGPAYVASKSAVMGLTRSLAHAAGPDGITVNCLNPGIIDTPMTAVLDGEFKREQAERTPLRRNGTPEDVAAAVLLLCSDAAGFVTGAHLDVNGGLAMT